MARADLPSGTVTFLFTDVEGSSSLLHEHGEAYAGLLAEHRRLLREAFARHGGVEVDTQGDAFFVAFARASEALAAAQDAQRALAPTPVRVRMGIHTGEPTVTAEGYVGIDVHKAARIAAAGHGGQVLVSEQTAQLVMPSDNSSPADLGLHRLKDLSAPQRLYQLGPGDFPPPRTLHQTNLPVPANPLVGRKLELADVLRLVTRERARAVTLTGPGGIGKTRFALAVAGESADSFAAGVWFVDLSPVRDPALVASTIAQTLGAKVELRAHVGDRELLLVLDNLEHVVEAAPALARLTTSCPRLQLLATSREPLGIAGEHRYGLRPLPESPAVELFRQRVHATGAEGEVAYPLAAEICDRVDRLPLAIELAAARVSVLEPEELLARLERRLPLLASRARDLPERQQTLTATIAWSYELLSSEEQQLFRRLAVFAGGATLAGAEHVAAAELDSLQSLVDKSLLRRRRERYVMLATIREYALERLADSGESDDIGRLHAEYFLDVAESANLAADREGPQRHDLVIPDRHNMRAALAWALERDEIELGLTLVVALENFWATTDPVEGRRWVDELLERGPAAPRELRARALRVAGGMTNSVGDWHEAERLFGEGLQECRALGDERGEAIMLHRLASVAIAREDWPRVRELAEQSLEGHRRTGFRKGEPQALTALAYVARADGDLERALALLRQSAEIADAIGFRWWLAGTYADIAAVSLEAARDDEARAWGLRALAAARAIGDRIGVVYGLTLVAEAASAAGDPARAGRLWGAADGELARAPAGIWLYRILLAKRGGTRADAEFERARDEGRQWSLDDAVEYALAES